jgi:hypothetical protein
MVMGGDYGFALGGRTRDCVFGGLAGRRRWPPTMAADRERLAEDCGSGDHRGREWVEKVLTMN